MNKDCVYQSLSKEISPVKDDNDIVMVGGALHKSISFPFGAREHQTALSEA
jgi:hypothetical protein